jgi:thiol-disulfide isomerase/thioredoxin
MKKTIILLAFASTLLLTKCTFKKQETSTSSDSVSTSATSSLVDVQNKVSDFKDVTNKSKVTYVDFWASWCGPCRGEMPASQALREEYAGKGVNFVYISLDEDKDAWAASSKNFALPDAQSFLIPNAQESAIPAKFNINSIPRYLLIDAKGNVVDDDAPRPSDTGSIKEALDKMLK